MQSQVAAVLVTHNSEQWIAKTIASVLQQTQAPVNIVIIDDRSTDDTMKILEQQQGLSPIPFTIQQASSSARNIATQAPDYTANHPEVPWVALYAMRNRVAHGYWSIDTAIVWQVVERDLPALEIQLASLVQPS